jgi:hypothetical protein
MRCRDKCGGETQARIACPVMKRLLFASKHRHSSEKGARHDYFSPINLSKWCAHFDADCVKQPFVDSAYTRNFANGQVAHERLYSFWLEIKLKLAIGLVLRCVSDIALASYELANALYLSKSWDNAFNENSCHRVFNFLTLASIYTKICLVIMAFLIEL